VLVPALHRVEGDDAWACVYWAPVPHARSETLVDDTMAEVRRRVRARLREELARVRPDSPLIDPAVFDDVETILREALAAREHLLLPHVLLEDEDWQMQRGLRFESHRRFLGRAIIAAKRGLLLPLTRWLFEYSRDNFVRQARVNDTLMASIEALVVEVVRLRHEVEATHASSPSASDPPAPR
jgi:hypothetical protein